MPQRCDAIISKSHNDIECIDLIQMHIAMMPDTAPIAAWPYPLTLKHHDFLKQEIKNLLDARTICKSMSPWARPIVVVKKHTPEGVPQQFCLCIDYRKVNSLLTTVTLAEAQRKALSHLCPCPKLMNTLHYKKKQSTSQLSTSEVVTTK